MEEKLNIFLFDKSKNLVENIKLKKPKTYYELLDTIKINMKHLPEYYDMFYLNQNEKIIIKNEETYQKVEDNLLIYELNNKNDINDSIFTENYNELSESKQNILDEKYNCKICEENIKNCNPLICYQCQNIYHKNCLEIWDNKCKTQNNNFKCPKCTYELPLNQWKEKINYEEERNNAAYIMNELNKIKIKEKDNNNINEINLEKYNQLKTDYERNIENISKMFKRYNENNSKLFEIIYNKCKGIMLLIDNYKINNNDKIKFNNDNEIFNEILNNLKTFENYIKDQKANNNINHGVNEDKKLNEEIIKNDQIANGVIISISELNNKDSNSSNNNMQIYEDLYDNNQQLNNVDIEKTFINEHGRKIFLNGLLKGIIHTYSEIDNVVSKIQNILSKSVIFVLVYKAIEDGDKASVFHEKCDELDKSLVIIETNKALRFGGFTTKTWEGKNRKKFDNNAFVFSLDNNKIYDIIKREPAIGCYPLFGPVFFGCQIRIYDNFFIKGGTTCRKGLNYSTQKHYELNDGEQTFIVKDIEVYGIA